MRIQNHLLTTFAIAAFLTATKPAFAGNWPQWRGPAFNGSSEETGLPDSWDKTNQVRWTAPMPGLSGATPIVWNKKVFISTPDEEKNLRLLCLDVDSGKTLWSQVVATGDKNNGQGNNMASPSPVTDGKLVYVLFGTGDLAAYDLDGGQIWFRNLGKDYGKFANMWLYGSSPLLFQNKLYIQVLQRDDPSQYPHAVDDKPKRDSYLLCLEPSTGKTIWKENRPTEAIIESQESYASPVPYQGKSGAEIIVVGGDNVTGHDSGTGKELWRCGGLNSKNNQWFRIITSPVTGDGLIFASAPKREPLLAIKEGGRGVVTDSHVAWRFVENPPDVCTPLFYQGKLFVLDGDKKVMTCLEPKTGKKIWSGELGVREIFKASPLGADGKIFCISERGTAVVLSAGEEFKILSTAAMGEEPCRASMAAADGKIFIRTAKNLYCVEKKKTPGVSR